MVLRTPTNGPLHGLSVKVMYCQLVNKLYVLPAATIMVPTRDAPKLPKILVRNLTEAEAIKPEVKTTIGSNAMNDLSNNNVWVK